MFQIRPPGTGRGLRAGFERAAAAAAAAVEEEENDEGDDDISRDSLTPDFKQGERWVRVGSESWP